VKVVTPPPQPDEFELRRKRAGLELSRARVLAQLEVATNERYRAMLQAALEHLERQLAELETH
jgi:hypothetical protein